MANAWRRVVMACFLLGCAAGAAAQYTPAKPAPAAREGEAAPAGTVTLAEGEASAASGTAAPRGLRVGDRIFAGDRLRTGAQGEIHVAMADGGVVALRPASEVEIERFKARGKPDDKSVFNLVAGALRSISGWIGKINPRAVQIRTPQATIGIRGTDHETVVVLPGNKEAAPGTYDKVNSGGTTMVSRAGAVDIGVGQAAHAAADRRAAPQLLDAVPAVFRPTRNEGRLDGVHDAIQPKLEGWRRERQENPAAAPTQIRGHTRIEAGNRNAQAVADGSNNRAANQAGVIGGE